MENNFKEYQFCSSFFQRFLQTLWGIFVSPKEKTCPKLLGRIQSLQRGAKEIEKQLKGIMAELQNKDGEEYSSLVTQVINPMLREVNQFEDDEKIDSTNGRMDKKGEALGAAIFQEPRQYGDGRGCGWSYDRKVFQTH